MLNLCLNPRPTEVVQISFPKIGLYGVCLPHIFLVIHINANLLCSNQICLINAFLIWMISVKSGFWLFSQKRTPRCTSLLLRKVAALGLGDLVKTPLIMKPFMCFSSKKHLPKYDYRVLIRTLISLEKKIQDTQLYILNNT